MVTATHVKQIGNQLRVYYDDGTSTFARPTQGVIWLVGGGSGGGGGEDVFKWPFEKDDFTTYPMHSGLDWPYASGTDIPIIGDGVVQEVYSYSGNTYPFDSSEPVWRGNCLVVSHGMISGKIIWSLYAHMLNAPSFVVGEAVTGGQIAGKVGNTGFSNGAHLHFEVIYNGDRLTNDEGGGAERAQAWMNTHTDGSHW